MVKVIQNRLGAKLSGPPQVKSKVNPTLKNGFANPTKVKIGQGQHRIDVKNDHWEKALKRAVVK